MNKKQNTYSLSLPDPMFADQPLSLSCISLLLKDVAILEIVETREIGGMRYEWMNE